MSRPSRQEYTALPRASIEESVEVHQQTDPDFRSSVHALIFHNLYFNVVLLVFFPLGIIAKLFSWGDSLVFTLNFIAIVALAKMLDLTTEQLSKRLGQTLGALVNASFGNAVELILSVMALREGLFVVVQASLLGSVLSNLLFVLGFCFFLGGLKHKTQKYSGGAANIDSSLLLVSMLGFMLPAAFSFQLESGPETSIKVLSFSRGTALLMLIIYASFMYFQLSTHPHLFASAEDDDEDKELIVNIPTACTALVISTILVGICAEFLVGSIEGITHRWNISETFVGMILIPIVGNAAEHVTAVFAAMRNQMDLAIGVSLGSSLQISVFVTPLLVVIGWIIGQPLGMDFPIFDIAVFGIDLGRFYHHHGCRQSGQRWRKQLVGRIHVIDQLCHYWLWLLSFIKNLSLIYFH
jgi:Ca2+:H+ antiporter